MGARTGVRRTLTPRSVTPLSNRFEKMLKTAPALKFSSETKPMVSLRKKIFQPIRLSEGPRYEVEACSNTSEPRGYTATWSGDPEGTGGRRLLTRGWTPHH